MINAVKILFLIVISYMIIQPVSGSIIVGDMDPCSNGVLKTPFIISGFITYTKGAPAWNPNITIANLNTSEHFIIRTDERSNFYRTLTLSDNVHTGDVLQITASDGIDINETVYKITQNDLQNAGFSQDLKLKSQKPDLVIYNYSMIWINPENRIFNITYTVKNIGETHTHNSTSIMQLDGIRVSEDRIPALVPCGDYSCEAGPFYCQDNKSKVNITICADNDHIIDEINERNNCLIDNPEYPLPNLHTGRPEILADIYGTYYISYRIDNHAYDVYASASNATINITTIENGSVISSELLHDQVPPLKTMNNWPESMHEKTIGPFDCLCNQTVIVEVYADADNEILESNETDNYRRNTLSCPKSACKPDLIILNCTEEWITNKTFNLIYTLANIGNGCANNSTISVNEKYYPSPALAPGENYSGTVGPIDLEQNKDKMTIEISADYFNNVNESNEDNNNFSYTTGVKNIYIYIKPVEWINGVNKTYNITFTIVNSGGVYFDESKAHVYIDNSDTPQAVYEIPGIPIKIEYSSLHCVKKTIGPFTMTGKNDTIGLCIEWEDGSYCKEAVYRYEGCIADDGTLFTCCSCVTKSCTFVQDMNCSVWHSQQRFPNGLFIGADNITIDGNGYAIIGDRDTNSQHEWIGIRNCKPGSVYSGHENVTIKNLEIRDFHYGITIVNTKNNTVYNCSIHDNGVIDRYHHGIAVDHSNHVTIDQCHIYNNTGIPTNKKLSGGHGISFDNDCSYGNVINSSISANFICGIYASSTCSYLNITDNLIKNNGLCGNSSSCSGINLHWKGGYGLITNSTVKNNVILNNIGSGIYVTQGYTTVMNNLVKASKNASDISGNGILIEGGKLTFLYNNTICDNEGTDISNTYNSFATFGDDNICDTTDNYNDEGTLGCIFYCNGVSGVCEGEHYNFSSTMVINESCRFNKSMRCMECARDGLIIGTDNITIDGAGYTITGNNSDTGILCEHTNVTIKNLQVKDFHTGIMIAKTNNNNIENCSVRKNFMTGINISSDNCTLTNNRIYDNTGPGIFIGGDYNNLENNTAAHEINSTINGTLPGYGIYFTAASKYNDLTGNAVGDNEAVDIFNNKAQTITGDNNTCDTTLCYYDSSMLEDKKYGCTYPWTTPDLVIMEKSEFWIDNNNKTYNIKYTAQNIAEPGSREAGPSTTYLHIDRHHVVVADDRLDTIEPGSDRTGTFDYTAIMSGEDDAITVCADGADDVRENNDANNFYSNEIGCYTIEGLSGDREANNCRDNVFKEDKDEISIPDDNTACVAADGTAYRCSDPYLNTIEKSCTFNGSMKCPDGCGLIIGKNGITIDGNESALIGSGNGSCKGIDESNPSSEDGDCGIYNFGYSDVTIKDLEISGFCNAIGLHGSGADIVKYNTIENCEIHNNGNPNSGSSHGIHMAQVQHSTIKNNHIYENTGTGNACGDGGNGIFMYMGCYNTISTNDIYRNSKGAIFMKKGSKSNQVIGNNVHENSQGGIIIRCISSGSNTIKDNTVNNNYGDGIFIGSSSNTIRNNKVEDNEAGHRVGDFSVENGDGIDMGRSDGSSYNRVNGNTVCRNAGMDIKTCGKDFGNTGTDNYCDNAKDFTGCTYSCADCSKPDLTVTGNSQVWLNPDDRTYDITYFVANIGNANVDDPIKIQVWIDDTWEEYTVESLQENDNYTNTIGPISMSQINDYIEIIVDPPDTIAEINENNNSLGKFWWAPEFSIDPSPENSTSSSGGGIHRGEIVTSDEQGEAAISGGEGFEDTSGNESMISLDTVRNVPARLFKSDSFFGGSEDTVHSSYMWIAITTSALLIILFIVGHYGEKIAHRRNKK